MRFRTSGDLAPDLRAVRVVEAAALEERAVLITEARRTVGADAVGELHAPAAPRRDAFHEWITVVARMPRAAADEHRHLPTSEMRRHGATAVPRLIRLATTRSCRARRRSGRENVSPLSRIRSRACPIPRRAASRRRQASSTAETEPGTSIYGDCPG